MLSKLGQPPPLIILEKKAEIERRIKLAEFHESMNMLTDDEINEIVQLKLDLDGLYCRWAKDEI